MTQIESLISAENCYFWSYKNGLCFIFCAFFSLSMFCYNVL